MPKSSLRSRRRRRRRFLIRRTRRAQTVARQETMRAHDLSHLSVRSDYLHMMLDPEMRDSCLRYALEQLTPRAESFDAFAVTGYSGVLLAGTLADRMRKGIILVRKESVDGKSHSSETVEGLVQGPVRYVFLDDFVATGETRNRVVDEVRRVNPDAKHVFTYTFRWGGRISDDNVRPAQPDPKAPEPEAYSYDFVYRNPTPPLERRGDALVVSTPNGPTMREFMERYRCVDFGGQPLTLDLETRPILPPVTSRMLDDASRSMLDMFRDSLTRSISLSLKDTGSLTSKGCS